MDKKLIFDLPTRLFHWVFALLFVIAFLIAKNVDDENPIFSYHMLAGILMGGLLVFRIIWGIVGTTYARFNSLNLNPILLIKYFKDIFTGKKTDWGVHNPASSWASVVMYASALMLAVSGVLMTTGYKESFEDVHELFANIFLVTVLIHIAGIILHTIRHKDFIGLSMIHGKKPNATSQKSISSNKPLSAITLAVMIIFSAIILFKKFDPNSQKLNLFGVSLQLGENEEEEEGEENEEEQSHEKENEDDDNHEVEED